MNAQISAARTNKSDASVISETERIAEENIAREKEKLDREFDDASRQAEKHLESGKATLREGAQSSLAAEKKKMVVRFEEEEQKTQHALQDLAERARKKEQEALSDLLATFLHLTF